MAGYAIIRIEGKYKNTMSSTAKAGKHTRSRDDMKKMAGHHERTSPVPNASKPYDTRHTIGNNDSMVAGVESCLPPKMKSDSVIAVEFLLTTSPESMRLDDTKTTGKLDDKKVQMFVDAAKEFMKEEFGKCAFGRAHFDEKTPHFALFVVPNEGFVPGAKLNAKKVFSPAVLESYQTKWFEKLNKFGLSVKRGEPGSQAEHEDINDYYKRVDQAQKELPPLPKAPAAATAGQRLAESVGVETEHSKAAAGHQRLLRERRALKEDQRKTAIAQATESKSQVERLTKRTKSAEKSLYELKNSTAELRALPLADVMQRLGVERHATDPLRWESQAGSVWLEKNDGQRFNSFDDPDLKGRGAIDLVMKVTALNFDQSVKFLAEEFGHERAAGDLAARAAAQAKQQVLDAVKNAPAPSLLPFPEPAFLPRVKAYLVEVRKLPARIIDKLISSGKIYADKFSNACFRTDDSGGVELRGTRDGQKWRGQHGQKTGFTVVGNPLKVAIVESSIEAISLNAIDGMTAVSVGGTNPRRALEIAREYHGKGATVYAAQNADKSGDDDAARLIKALNVVERLRPPKGQDWNDVLKSMTAEQRAAVSAPAANPAPASAPGGAKGPG